MYRRMFACIIYSVQGVNICQHDNVMFECESCFRETVKVHGITNHRRNVYSLPPSLSLSLSAGNE